MTLSATRSNEWRFPARSIWILSYLFIVGGGLFVAAIARRRVTVPFLGLSLVLILLLVLGWVLHPRATVYATLFLTTVSEYVTVWWFPFARNFSNRESISYLSDSLIISPLDVTLVSGVLISCLRRYANTGRLVARSPLTRPLLIFMAFIALGFVRGVGSNGDLRAALYEVRALPYILMMFIIVVNECTERVHLRAALWSVLLGVIVQSALTIEHFSRLSVSKRADVDGLTEHASSVGQVLLLVTFVCFVLFARRVRLARWAVFLGLMPTMYVFIIAERRAGVAALAAGFGVVAISLYWHRRRAFWSVVPLMVIVVSGYVGAFWNSTASAGFPAQAIKAAVAPGSARSDDRNSDIYRILETYDLVYTIRATPILGLGFGQVFFRPAPLPDISSFELNAYMPHNAVLWIWVKTGFGGFVTMFYIFAKSLLHAADRIRRSVLGVDLVVSVAAASLIVMYGVYTYVDVSWDPRNSVFLGTALAMCTMHFRSEQPEVVTEEPPNAIDRSAGPERGAEVPATYAGSH